MKTGLSHILTAVGIVVSLAVFMNFSHRAMETRIMDSFDRLELRIDRLELRIDSLDARVRAVEVAIGKIGERLGFVEQRLSVIERAGDTP